MRGVSIDKYKTNELNKKKSHASNKLFINPLKKGGGSHTIVICYVFNHLQLIIDTQKNIKSSISYLLHIYHSMLDSLIKLTRAFKRQFYHKDIEFIIKISDSNGATQPFAQSWSADPEDSRHVGEYVE